MEIRDVAVAAQPHLRDPNRDAARSLPERLRRDAGPSCARRRPQASPRLRAGSGSAVSLLARHDRMAALGAARPDRRAVDVAGVVLLRGLARIRRMEGWRPTS